MTKRIVYIEDNPFNLQLVRKMLQQDGYEILDALDGDTGLRLVYHTMPDLILMDINLPDIDGLEITRHLKRDTSTKHIPIVALTANNMIGDQDNILQTGCDGYIAKPITRQKLRDTVASFLDTEAITI